MPIRQKEGGKLHENLRRKKKYRKRLGSMDNRGKIKNQINISKRPKVVDKRERVGDFEVDLVIGANHKGALLIINELATGYAKVRKLKSQNAKEVSKMIVKDICSYLQDNNF